MLSVVNVKEVSQPISHDTLSFGSSSSRSNVSNGGGLGPSPREPFDIFLEQSIDLETLFKEVPPCDATLSSGVQSAEVRQPSWEGYVRSDKSCFYVRGMIDKVRGSFLIDTGSTVSVLSDKVVEMIGRTSDLKPLVEKLTTASGEQLELKGKLDLDFQIEHLNFSQSFIVAEIDEAFGILGMDFLQENNANIKIGKRILKTTSGKLRLYKQTSRVCARLVLENSVEIPPRSEMFLNGYVDRASDGVVGIFEPNEKFITQGLLVGRTLVDTTTGRSTIPVMNIKDQPCKIRSDALMGSVQVVSGMSSLGENDGSDGTQGFNAKENGRLPEHLLPLVQNTSKNLSPEEKQKVSTLISEFGDIFVGPDGQLGQTNLAEHYIDTGDTKPFKLPARRIPMFKRPIVEKEVDRMLEQGVIEPSTSPWNSPICLVTKPDGSCRFCIDLRALNAVTKLDAYPLPRADETLDRLAGSKYFSTLDLASGYWQLKLNEFDRPKTAFRIPGKGHFQFKVTCFGLKNAAGSFERLMEIVLQGLQHEKCLVYLDDVIIKGETFEEALSNLRDVFLRFRQSNLRLKPSKCKLFREEVVFLGHLVSKRGVTCNPAKVEVIRSWPQPQNKTQIRQFVGLVNYYRRMIPFCADRVQPLTKLTKKNIDFVWGKEQEAAFNDMKTCLTTSPILGFPQENGGPLICDTDASGFAIGGVLSQIQEGEERVIAYGSHALNPAQQQYCTTKRELYAVVYFLQHFKQYLLGRKFILRCDHAPLKWLCSFREPEGILARWLSIIGPFDFEIQYRPGRLHSNVDPLSRIPSRKCVYPDCADCNGSGKDDAVVPKLQMPRDDPLMSVSSKTIASVSDDAEERTPNWLGAWTRAELKRMQEKDAAISELLVLKQEHRDKPPRADIRCKNSDTIGLWMQWEILHLKDELLYRKWLDKAGREIDQLVAPQEIRRKIFTELHGQRYAGHLGRDRTTSAVRNRFYWPNMGKDLKRWCRECDSCARAKPGPGRGRAPIQHISAFQPMSVMAVDILGPLVTTRNGNNYIIVCGDYYTKWKEAFAVPDHQAMTVADKLITEVFLRFGFPSQLHSDQGREFESQLFKSMCTLLGVDKTRTCPYNPKSDGMIERYNRSLLTMLSMFVNDNHDDWDEQLPYVMAAYRATEHKSTSCTPNLLMLNRETTCPLDLMVGYPPGQEPQECHVAYVEWVRQTMRGAHELAFEALGQAATRQSRYYNRDIDHRKFSKGDWVWRHYTPKANQKLGLAWDGPYLVLDVLTAWIYKIQKSSTTAPVNVHVDHLKPYEGSGQPRDWTIEEDNPGDPDDPEPPDTDDEYSTDGEADATLVAAESEPELGLEKESAPGATSNRTETAIPYVPRSRRERRVKPREVFSPS